MLLCSGAQDKLVKGKIDARNSLETYVYNIKSSVEDKLKGKISEEDAEKVKKAIAETVEWLDENSDAEQARSLCMLTAPDAKCESVQRCGTSDRTTFAS